MSKRLVMVSLGLVLLGYAVEARAQFPGYGFSPRGGEGLGGWQLKRSQNFWNRTSPFFGDPYYDPLKTSPASPFRSPQNHPWRTSPFRGDPYYDPYAARPDGLNGQRQRISPPIRPPAAPARPR
jgi:hypothetical protein